MMAAILNSAMLDSDTAILDSDTLLSSLRFTQKHSSSTLTLTQTNSIWLNLIMATILNLMLADHLEFCHLGFSHFVFSLKLTHKRLVPNICTNSNFTHSFWLNLMMAAILNSPSWIWPFLHKKNFKLIHSDSTWSWQPSWILLSWIQTLPSWIQTLCYLLSDSLKNTSSTLTLTQTNSIWLT